MCCYTIKQNWIIFFTFPAHVREIRNQVHFLLEYVEGWDNFGFWQDHIQIAVVALEAKQWIEVGLFVIYCDSDNTDISKFE